MELCVGQQLRLEVLPLEMIDAIFKLLPTTERNKLIRVNKQLRLELVGTSLFALPASSAPFRQDLDHFILFGQALQANDWETCWFSSSSLNRVARFELFSSCVPSRFVQLYRLRTIAGAIGSGKNGDGDAAIDARILSPDGAYLYADGRVVIADTHHHRLREVDSSGIIRTVAGTGEITPDGNHASSPFPSRVLLDSHGRYLFIQDTPFSSQRKVRRVEPNGKLSTLYESEGPLVMTASRDGRIFVMSSKTVTVLEENGMTHDFIRPINQDASLHPKATMIPRGIHACVDGRLLVAEWKKIYLLDDQGNKTVIAGIPPGTEEYEILPKGDGGVCAKRTKLPMPFGVCEDPQGRVWFVDRFESGAYMIDVPTGLLYLVAGKEERKQI